MTASQSQPSSEGTESLPTREAEPSEMVERVARAMIAAGDYSGPWTDWIPEARAAIEAMRWPTEAMKWAAWKAELAPGVGDGYPIYDNLTAPSRGEEQVWLDVMGAQPAGGCGARQYSDWEVNALGVAYTAMIDAALAEEAK